jgi:thioredoxin-like negative regulator of GroEL
MAMALGGVACGSGDAGPSSVATGEEVVTLTSANFQQLVLESSQACLVEFYRPDCGACRAMTQTIAQLAYDYRGRALVGTVNVATETALASQYDIWGTPTFIVFRGGDERDRIVGARPYADLAQLLEASM